MNGTAAITKASGSNFNNLGVPGIRVFDVTLQGYGADALSGGNPYFYRMIPATDPSKTYLEFVAESNATFFTCWLGNNDVLGYATSGGAAGVDGSDALYSSGITPTAIFDANYKAVITALTNGGAQGVVVTIPNVTDIPYFTTIKPVAIKNALVFDAGTAAALNAAYAPYNAGVTAWNSNAAVPAVLHRPKIFFKEGANYPVIVDESLSDVPGLPKYRMLTGKDLLLLTLPTAQIPAGLGTATAIPSQYTLTESEQESVSTAIAVYNKTIRGVATTNANIALWDANAFFSDFVENGYSEGSLRMSADFISGTAFSLDGVHATPRGYALVANQIIKTINTQFGVTVLPVKMQDYRTVKLQE